MFLIRITSALDQDPLRVLVRYRVRRVGIFAFRIIPFLVIKWQTFHLPFECEKLAESLWRMLSEIISADLRRRGVQTNIIFFAHNVIYNLDIAGVEAAYGAKIRQYIQGIRHLFIIKGLDLCPEPVFTQTPGS
jgi:hypothetical protein